MREAGAPLLEVGVERELRDDEEGTADLIDAQVHLARCIGEDAHMRDLLGQPVTGLLIIFGADA